MPSAKEMIPLPSIIKQTKKSPSRKVSTERQHKGHIHLSTKAQSWTEAAEVTILCPSMLMNQTKAKGV